MYAAKFVRLQIVIADEHALTRDARHHVHVSMDFGRVLLDIGFFARVQTDA